MIGPLRPRLPRPAGTLLLAALAALSLPALGEGAPSTPRCVACHAEQAALLAQSRHGLASGPGLWGQLPSTGPHLGSALACLLCHAPARDQGPWLAEDVPVAPHPGQTETEARIAALGAATRVHPNPDHDPHATALGVSCTACHVQGGRIVSVRARAPGPGMPHAVEVDPDLSRPESCARCHQFGADAAVNGKPLENTVAEWRASRWGQAGATCQSCHMPDGAHLFQGIHTPSLVAASVEVGWDETGTGQGALRLTNTAVGHAFPTYTTPRVVLAVQAEDASGRPVGPRVERVLARQVHFEGDGWKEDSDTRVQPGATAVLAYRLHPQGHAVQLHATVRVEPDSGYIAIDRRLLEDPDLPEIRREMLQTALARARQSGYVIFDERRRLSQPPRGQAGGRPPASR